MTGKRNDSAPMNILKIVTRDPCSVASFAPSGQSPVQVESPDFQHKGHRARIHREHREVMGPELGWVHVSSGEEGGTRAVWIVNKRKELQIGQFISDRKQGS